MTTLSASVIAKLVKIGKSFVNEGQSVFIPAMKSFILENNLVADEASALLIAGVVYKESCKSQDSTYSAIKESGFAPKGKVATQADRGYSAQLNNFTRELYLHLDKVEMFATCGYKETPAFVSALKITMYSFGHAFGSMRLTTAAEKAVMSMTKTGIIKMLCELADKKIDAHDNIAAYLNRKFK